MIFTAPDLPQQPLSEPLIYLNGPIQGCADWQREALTILTQHTSRNMHFANPRAKSFNGKLEDQLQWSQVLQEQAAVNGVQLFLFPKETSHRCNRSYAQAARFELGEWAIKSQAGLARVVVGFERGFTGGAYLRRRLQLSYPNIPVCSSIRQTCMVAIEMAKSQPTALAYPYLKAGLRPPALGTLVQGLGGVSDDD
jgi:hypothetical protein